MKRPSVRSALKVSAIIAALVLALVPFPAPLIERFYSNGLYPSLQSLLTPLSNRVPFALFDLLFILAVIGLPIWWGFRLARAGGGKRLRTLGWLSFHTVVLIAVLLLGFQVVWGLNYLRQPLSAKLEYDEQRLTPEALNSLVRTTVEHLNSDCVLAHKDPWPDEGEWRGRLQTSFDATVIELGNRSAIAPAVPKSSVLNSYLAAAGIDGFMNPFGDEVILDSELLPVERPFTLAHEWAHLAGFADESEAGFVGLLSCLRSEMPVVRYSGWLALYGHLPRGALAKDDGGRAESELRLAPEVTADLRAIGERAKRHINARLRRVQAKVYDGFLKANRVEAGIGSYGLMVRLVMGTRFEPDWVPARRRPH